MTTEFKGARPDVTRPELFINRELSQLKFNERVLEQARDQSAPLLERLKFLCISCSNLDEFFEIRVGGLKQHIEYSTGYKTADDIPPTQLLIEIKHQASRLVEEQYKVFNEIIIPALAEQNVELIPRERWTTQQRAWIHKYFTDQVEPVLSPLGIDPGHPFPRILNKSLNFIVEVGGTDAFGRDGHLAIVQAPRSLPRLIELPDEDSVASKYVFLSSIIHAYVHELFEGLNIHGCYQFRVTRNSDLFVEDEIDDLMLALEGELASRRYGDAVRLETSNNTPDHLTQYLLQQFHLTETDLYRVNGPVNLNRLSNIYDLLERPDLKFAPFTAKLPQPITPESNLFKVIAQEDVLMHHPYQSFTPVISFIHQAAKDPKVLAIKQTLYRTGAKSRIVDALVQAAEAGKEVTVVIELMARFDEAANITLANRLQKAGAHVVYGIVGIKTHAKMILIIRREQGKLVRYAHLGTGNYHQSTAKLYTDYGMFTSDPKITLDLHEIFLQLTSFTKIPKLENVLQAPFTLYKTIVEYIDKETKRAVQGRKAKIIAQINSLIEPQLIQALYRASQAGVEIKLIVRGQCCLRPGVPGVSENIEVRSIIGRFLEHPRVFYFYNGGRSKLYCSSADWMDRNFFRRVEAAWPIEDRMIRKRILAELDLYLNDNQNAWLLHADGNYVRSIKGQDKKVIMAQTVLLERYAIVK
ncbi:MAG: polyphosphate kinase 1 [Candidatus Thioglobus sp.]|nr:MAG: polyphosphate kinase 1 [Candidatus Thioglobus sp.]|tara:strand:- start:2399 stop:4486 length:2088 start_codon:yes stop_codon:yes gene_type:complete